MNCILKFIINKNFLGFEVEYADDEIHSYHIYWVLLLWSAESLPCLQWDYQTLLVALFCWMEWTIQILLFYYTTLRYLIGHIDGVILAGNMQRALGVLQNGLEL
jgi:hypothetical protein